MQKTLAQFKRDINIGDSILCLKIEEGKSLWPDQGYTPLIPITLNPKMAVLRLITYKDTTGFYLKGINDTNARGSFCNFPKATALEYIDNYFTITETDQAGNIWQKRYYQIIK
jgi:hypothetical protein